MAAPPLPACRDPLCLASALAAGIALHPGVIPAGAWLVGMAAWLVHRARHRGLIAAFAAGLLWADPPAPPLVARDRVRLTVQVESPTKEGPHGSRTAVRAWSDSEGSLLPAELLRLEEASTAPPRRTGELLAVRGRRSPGRLPRNPGEFDPWPATLESGQVRVVSSGPWWTRARAGFGWIRRRGIDTLQRSLPRLPAALAVALLFGDRSELPPEWRDRLRATGTAHLFALSGLHVGLVAAMIDRLLAGLGCRALLPRLVLIWTATLTSGAAAPVLRAATAVSLWWWSVSRGRRVALQGPFAWALIGVLWASPSTGSASICLSFAAVLGIATGSRWRPRSSPRRWRSGQAPWIRVGRLVWMGLCASLATAPFCASFFGCVTPWSPLSTLALLPFIVPWILLSLAALLASSFAPDLLSLIGGCFELSAGVAELLLLHLDRLPGTPLPIPRPGLALLVVHAVALLSLSRGRQRLAAVLWAGLLHSVLLHEDPPPAICLLDVGHGQCLVWRDGGATDLADAGGKTSPRLERPLRALGVSRLRYVFLSHLDHDHCSGLAELVTHLPVRTVVLSSSHRDEWEQSAAAGLSELRSTLQSLEIPVLFVSRGRRLGPWTVHWPPAGRRFPSRNEGSLVLSRDQGDGRRWLLPGDLRGFPLLEMARGIGAVSFLVLPHHGNPDPGLNALLEVTTPDQVLASRGAPLSEEVEEALRMRGLRAHSTHAAGALYVRTTTSKVWSGARPPGLSCPCRLLFRTEPTPVTTARETN